MERKPGESVQDLAARIRQDAASCDFNSILNKHLSITDGAMIKNEAVLKPLFKHKDKKLSFAESVKCAQEIEDAAHC